MIRVCRLTRAIYATPPAHAYDGRGAALTGQRWNARGLRAAYASQSLSLSALEYLGTLVDINDAPADLVAVDADLDDNAVETVDVTSLPGWDAIPPDASVRFGSAWIHERRSVALRVPSVMIRSEANYVLNPDHPNFQDAIIVRDSHPFAFDQRLLRIMK